MAIFSRKSDKKDAKQGKTAEPAVQKVQDAPAAEQPKQIDMPARMPMLIYPRLSEKANALVRLNKYVFKVGLRTNKVEIRKAVEKSYGVKVASVNIIRMQGKPRRYGRFTGKMSDFKKAIVTLTPDSKKIDAIESS